MKRFMLSDPVSPRASGPRPRRAGMVGGRAAGSNGDYADNAPKVKADRQRRESVSIGPVMVNGRLRLRHGHDEANGGEDVADADALGLVGDLGHRLAGVVDLPGQPPAAVLRT